MSGVLIRTAESTEGRPCERGGREEGRVHSPGTPAAAGDHGEAGRGIPEGTNLTP